jgi:hypothetical protein
MAVEGGMNGYYVFRIDVCGYYPCSKFREIRESSAGRLKILDVFERWGWIRPIACRSTKTLARLLLLPGKMRVAVSAPAMLRAYQGILLW